MALIDNGQLKKFKEALEAIIVSSQGLTYDACKDVAEKEAAFLISVLLQEPNIQSSDIKETICAEIDRRMKCYDKDGCEPNSGKWVELVTMKRFIESIQQEQPVEGLDAEIERYWNRATGFQPKFAVLELTKEDLAKVARHFAKWGAEHLKK